MRLNQGFWSVNCKTYITLNTQVAITADKQMNNQCLGSCT
uniref:Uncharacterized protein n=1 Tax=Anguilla anguilla TaxID=7936 RepID=A0A0E9QBQ7_ANGAN